MRPMLAAPIDGIPEGDGFVIEPKLDGWRALAERINGRVYLTTRTGNTIDTVPYINEALAALLPEDTLIDGELIDGEHAGRDSIVGWGTTQGALTRTSAVQSNGSMVFVAFDVIRLAGENARSNPLTERRKVLKAMLTKRRVGKRPVRVIPQEPLSVEAHERHLADGMEGSVVKRATSRYRPGSRSGGWYKIKPQAEAEAIATGFYDATSGSKYEGWAVGGITWRLPNGYEGRSAGMNDAERAHMYEAQQGRADDVWTGNVIELRHHGVTESGALRHPQYQRVRDPLDKATADERGSTMATATVKAPKVSGGRRRNYAAMKPEKLALCIEQLEDRQGDAYDRCMSGGSGDVEGDLEYARGIAEQKAAA